MEKIKGVLLLIVSVVVLWFIFGYLFYPCWGESSQEKYEREKYEEVYDYYKKTYG